MNNVIQITRLSIYTSASPDLYTKLQHIRKCFRIFEMTGYIVNCPATLSRELNTRKQIMVLNKYI
jgi:hypothetical protein